MMSGEIQDNLKFRNLELGGGQVIGGRPSPGHPLRLHLPPILKGYADAQLDDYGLPSVMSRKDYPWRPGVSLKLEARFSHDRDNLGGTAGFGFWNAPFGDPTVRWPALPQAVWFFFASAPNNLPLAPVGTAGQGWFAATLDATTRRAKSLIPLAPFILLGNQLSSFRQRLWPYLQQRLGISFASIPLPMNEWHIYQLEWLPEGCVFAVDGRLLLRTPHSPTGPLGFVCWFDNQYMIVTPRGKFSWGTLKTRQPQWLEIRKLEIKEQPPEA
jgi:hypothetical protein